MEQYSSIITRYIAFLRAINVGGHTVKMDYLRKLFASLGVLNVETFIASGNVIFDAPAQDTRALEQMIEDCLQTGLGYRVATFMRTASDVAAIAGYQPFTPSELDTDGNSLFIGFLPAPLDSAGQQRLLALRTQDDDFHTHQREVYWLRRGRISDSAVSGALLEKTMGMPATLRNATTIRRLAAKYPAPA